MKNKILVILLFFLFLISSIFSITGFLYHNVRKNVIEGFYLKGEENIVIDFGDEYEESGFVARINNKDYTNKVNVKSNVNINKLGDYEITYSINYKNYNRTLKRNIKVVDHTFPSLNIKCDMDQYIPLKGTPEKCDISANDNYDKNITDKITVDSNLNINKIGDYKITYSVSDSSHNKVTKALNIHVRKKNDITYINISIAKQRLDYYSNKKLVLTTPITSGRNNATKLGEFKIQNKVRNTTLSGDGYVSFVEYWMGYDGAYGLHDASWRSAFGTKDFYYTGSHGCVNMPINAAKKLYNLVELGTPVYIKK